MVKWLIPLIILSLLIPVANASIGIGVEPTKAWVTLSNSNPQEILKVKIYNPSTTPANYTFLITDDMKDYVSWECDNSIYWCLNSSYIVPAGLDRSDGMIVDMLFMKKTDVVTTKNFTIIVRAEPMLNQTGTVGIVPQVTIDIYLNQVYIPTTITVPTTTILTTTTQYSGSSDNPTTSSTSTTTTNIIQRILNKPTTTSITTTTVSPRDAIVSGVTTTIPQKKGFVWDFWSYLVVAVVIVLMVVVGIFGYLKFIYG
jgi:hypothetical protein